jgi:hypothetical protein
VPALPPRLLRLKENDVKLDWMTAIGLSTFDGSIPSTTGHGRRRHGLLANARAIIIDVGRTAAIEDYLSSYFLRIRPNEPMLFAILEKSIEFFPESFTACEILAAFYASRGKKELSLKYFHKVLELDPGNQNAARMIRELQR